MTAPTPQHTAERVRDAMFAADRAAQALGIRIAAVAPGSATATLTVRPDMLNGHAICHGGLISTLADTAFAYACNSYDEATLAAGFSIDFLAPAQLADELEARAVEVAKAGRSGVYDVVVSNQRGERIAVFRGRSATLRRPLSVAG